VAAGERREVRITLAYYVSGLATFNHRSSYWYTQYFDNIQSVFSYALEHFDAYAKEAEARDAELLASGLTEAQQFMIAHSTRSYYGSTQWLIDLDGKPLWVVNEGEYLMMNTLDLTVDMQFFELHFNPWTVRNVLEQFATAYSYEDEIFAPEAPENLLPGGISFTHDMGVANHFSPQGFSSYECSGLDRLCFSYMTCEQLTNWVLCAGVYLAKSKDLKFARKHTDVLKRCFDSLLRRDHPDPTRRNGLMSYESSRTKGGGEITTYESPDPANKSWTGVGLNAKLRLPDDNTQNAYWTTLQGSEGETLLAAITYPEKRILLGDIKKQINLTVDLIDTSRHDNKGMFVRFDGSVVLLDAEQATLAITDPAKLRFRN
jgi:hypothetical protein